MRIVAILAGLSALVMGACTVNSTTNGNSNTCGQDSSVSCTSGTGYSCSGTDTPQQDFSSLDCGGGVANGTNTDYCCITLQSGSSCSADSSVQGCASGSFGFSCTSSDTPDQADSSLTCSTGTAGNGGETLYCCCTGSDCTGGTGVDAGGDTCTQDSSVSCTDSNATGYQCTSTVSPDQENTGIACSNGTADGSNTDYCCIPSSSSVTCTQDSTVSGCQAGSFGFSCTGSDTPSQEDSNLTCSTGTAGSNGATLYCCTD
jgi:hypothetical protein